MTYIICLHERKTQPANEMKKHKHKETIQYLLAFTQQSPYCSAESMQAKFHISPPIFEIAPIWITLLSTYKVGHIYPTPSRV
jgi:hypothetical protein